MQTVSRVHSSKADKQPWFRGNIGMSAETIACLRPITTL